MLPRLRAAVAELSIDEVAQLAAQVTLPDGPDIPAVLTAVRLAVVAPEPGDGPHSSLVAALAPWTAGQTRTASAKLCGNGSSHREVWVALGHELAAAGGVEAPVS